VIVGRLGAGSLGRFALARGIGVPSTANARATQVVAEVLGAVVNPSNARVTQLVVEVLSPAARERSRAVMI
jgi:hypothetical protein